MGEKGVIKLVKKGYKVGEKGVKKLVKRGL